MIVFDNINQNRDQHIHLIGIGGISMSAIAELLINHGYKVSGSDIKDSKILDRLRGHGAQIFIGHDSNNIQNPDLVVYTAAIRENNCERLKARQLNITEIDRAEMLGLIMKNYSRAIAVAGSHGKTTTTSLVSLILEYADLDPTIFVGGELDEIGGNIKIGESEHFITEACEYVESFLKFFPFIGIILNIDEDHLDYFRDIVHIKHAFKKFIDLIPREGFLVANKDDKNIEEIIRDTKCNLITYGINNNNCNFTARDIAFTEEGLPVFNVDFNNENMGIFKLNIPGMHNIYNALASIATAHILGVSPPEIKKHIKKFKGIHRRFDILGEIKGCKIIDDYAHHPAEIRATLEAAQNYPHREIWCVFQPHTFTRTRALLDDFASSFDNADHIIITDIYAAREVDTGEINSRTLVNKVKEYNPENNVLYMKDFGKISKYIYENMEPGDIVLTMGAGNICNVGKMMLKL
ncbi:MAG: UDP-N-acetylmuramate--L-alanine ligase [Candidatus Alkaliphilus sp. MAG34]